ncbi:unnamed protein product [Peniophora sp. CBMAI 1063]|nr:unnamed protein product [Peniophora sp. CBMAI 1063]
MGRKLPALACADAAHTVIEPTPDAGSSNTIEDMKATEMQAQVAKGLSCTCVVFRIVKPTPEITSSYVIENVKAKIQNKGYSSLAAATFHILVEPARQVGSSNAIDNVKAKMQDTKHAKEASKCGAMPILVNCQDSGHGAWKGTISVLFEPLLYLSSASPRRRSSRRDMVNNVKAKIQHKEYTQLRAAAVRILLKPAPQV